MERAVTTYSKEARGRVAVNGNVYMTCHQALELVYTLLVVVHYVAAF